MKVFIMFMFMCLPGICFADENSSSILTPEQLQQLETYEQTVNSLITNPKIEACSLENKDSCKK